MNKLPYAVKEKINLFALDTVKDYEMLKEFNKIIDYEPCEYSNRNLYYAETRYKRIKETFNTELDILANNLMYDYSNCLLYECDILKIWNYKNDIEKKYRNKNPHYKIVHPNVFRKR